MSYVALYRKWRPQDFDSLVGQEHISTTLKNAVASGKIAHAYLFSGSRGTGKTSAAKILAKAINCKQDHAPWPCNNCLTCKEINSGASMDVFEIDAASNRGIDEIRDLRETIKFAPAENKYKVYIIDEVHMLTTEAFNALLKTLEEPPAHVVFILATTEPHKIPATIHSRCQRYDFRRIGTRQIEERLLLVAKNTDIEITDEAISLIAAKADGAMRDALSVLDQCIAFDKNKIDASLVRKLLGLIGHELVWSMSEAILQKDASDILTKIDEMVNNGKDVRQLLLETTLHMRSLMLYKAAPNIDTIEMYSENKEVLARQSALVTHEEIVKILDILHEALSEVKWAEEPRIQAEMALISACRRGSGADITALMSRLDALEKKMAAGGGETSLAPKQEMKIPAGKTSSIVRQNAKDEKLFHVEQFTTSSKDAGKNSKPPAKHVLPVEEELPDAKAVEPEHTTADLPQIWDAVLKEALSAGKRSLHACIMQGQLTKMTDTLVQIEFSASFPKERTEKEDFRIMAENILAQVTGRPRKIVCTLGGGKAIKKEAIEKIKIDGKMPETQEMQNKEPEHPALVKAREMFGGKTEKIDNNY